jgi:hypothetical protein
VKIPITEITLNAMSGSDMAANASVHRFNETRQMASATTSQAAANHRDVTQSQLTTGDWLDTEQPHGLDHMTNTESRAASSARAANPSAMKVVERGRVLLESAIS